MATIKHRSRQGVTAVNVAAVTPELVQALEHTIKGQVFDLLEQTLDIAIPKAVREALKVQPATPHAQPAPVQASEVKRPAPGGRCAAVWDALDQMRAKGKHPKLEDIQKVAGRHRWNENNTRIEFYRWRHAVGEVRA